MMSTHQDSANTHVRTLLDAAGIAVEGEDFDAVVRLYQRFGDQRARLAAAELSESEPLTIVELTGRQGDADERI